MNTGDRNTLSLLGEQAKVNTSDATTRARLVNYLRGLPSLDFSDKGRATICQRFGVNADELAAAIAQQARPGRATAALLRTIGAAITAAHGGKTKRGGLPC